MYRLVINAGAAFGQGTRRNGSGSVSSWRLIHSLVIHYDLEGGG
jgi:hypothetical protein